MKTYLLYIHDDRYTVPTLQTLDSPDDETARGLAAARLSSSRHHRAVEVFDEGEMLVFRVERDV